MSINIPITYIEFKNLKVYISETPIDSTVLFFIDYIKNNNIKHIVRLCEPKYQSNIFDKLSIIFHDLKFVDGSEPSYEIINNWLEIIKLNEPILVHCLAGLGRSPTLVAIALIINKMNSLDAIELIRINRPGAFNSKQINFISNYKLKKKNFIQKYCF